jgi:hypothetical protein
MPKNAAATLRARAAELRRLAQTQDHDPTKRTLLAIADEFESLIDEMVKILKKEPASSKPRKTRQPPHKET